MHGRGRSAGGEPKQHARPLTSQRRWECSALASLCCLAPFFEHRLCQRPYAARTHNWPPWLPDYNQFVQESKELKEFKDVVETLTGQNEQCDLDPLKLPHTRANPSVCLMDGSGAFE